MTQTLSGKGLVSKICGIFGLLLVTGILVEWLLTLDVFVNKAKEYEVSVLSFLDIKILITRTIKIKWFYKHNNSTENLYRYLKATRTKFIAHAQDW